MTMLFVTTFTKKKLKFAATGLRKHDLRLRDLKTIQEMLANETLKTVIDRVYPLERMQESHAYVDSGRKRGNVIVKMG
jgi:NADPH:quinone reductase-like Zn-dependent oxidoreductase